MPGAPMTLQDQLVLSIRQYRAILLELNRLEADLSALPSEQLVAFAQAFSEQQEEAAQTDRQIEEALAAAGGAAEPALNQQRVALMHQVQERNRLLSQKLHGMMSVISDELSQLRSGRSAMAGYGGARDSKGATISRNY